MRHEMDSGWGTQCLLGFSDAEGMSKQRQNTPLFAAAMMEG
jgi:hypothetical protein